MIQLLLQDKRKAWIGQPHLINKMERIFGDMVKDMSKYKTPGTPHQQIARPKEDSTLLSEDEQKLFRTGVGLLLYLTKYSRPDICNAVREGTKCMQKATPAAWKEVKRTIKFVLDTKQYGLKLEPKIPSGSANEWDVLVYSDADWAGDPDNRRSVSGYVIFLMGCPICWTNSPTVVVKISSISDIPSGR